MLKEIITNFHGFMIWREDTIEIGLEKNGICFPYIKLYFDSNTKKFKLKSLKRGYEIDVGEFEYDFLLSIKREVSKINIKLYDQKNSSSIKSLQLL